ncbi:hypothetical protein L6Q21_09560 [Sandaracinobacter sp. RS1-74]|uniref:hypothetical protein n=1 Tax=Sandaracinobacteroides sayramensis TaxID=2913411 RepID=UPI001EDC524B|nr:hypothetical protein [Sandaracinobacteroides sayramensis]MCG2841225.1 hypothetical protein [Sandaracinobacteroides sayramensis]
MLAFPAALLLPGQRVPALRRAAFALFGGALLALGGSGARAQAADAQASASSPITPAEAQAVPSPSAPARIGGGAPSNICVQVDIGGTKVGHLDCATQRLQAAARTAQDQARAGLDAPVAGAGSPDPQTGVISEAGVRLRMGNALGHSVHPERPNRRAAVPR